MHIRNMENETLILFNDAEPTAEIYTFNVAFKRKLAALCQMRPDAAKLTRDDGNGALTFTVPKKWVKVYANRILTDEQKAKAASHLRKRI